MNYRLLLALPMFGFTALAVIAADSPVASTSSASAASPPASTPTAASGPYHFIKEIAIPGVTKWDYLAVDSAAHRLYVSHGAGFAVIDLEQDAFLSEITGLSGVHGIAIVPALNEGFISNGSANNVSVVDLKTLQVTKTVPTATNPDWIMYEPEHKEIYAFNGRSQSTTVIDAATGNVTTTIPLGGKPETAMVDPKAGRIYDNLEDKFSVAVIDTKEHKVITTWPAVKGKGASGMAIDLEHHRLFLGCEDTMAMMDSTTGKVLAILPAAAGIDAAAFDPGTQYAFTSGGSGTVTIAKEDGDKLTLVQTLTTASGARTMTIDPATHRIYLAVGSAGAFKVLVYGMDDTSTAKK